MPFRLMILGPVSLQDWEQSMSRNFELLRKIGSRQQMFHTGVASQHMVNAPLFAPQTLAGPRGIERPPATSSASGLNTLPQTSLREQGAMPSNPKHEQIGHHSAYCDLCCECGLSMAANSIFCPNCGSFQGSIITEDPARSATELPQPTASFVRRIAVWLRVLRR
jgi:hypothetical protein